MSSTECEPNDVVEECGELRRTMSREGWFAAESVAHDAKLDMSGGWDASIEESSKRGKEESIDNTIGEMSRRREKGREGTSKQADPTMIGSPMLSSQCLLGGDIHWTFIKPKIGQVHCQHNARV